MSQLRSLLLCTLSLLALATPALAESRFVEEFLTLDESVWSVNKTGPTSNYEVRPLTVRDKDTGEIRLEDRTFLATKRKYAGPTVVEVEFTHEETGGGIPYSENFQVKTKSTGATKPEWNYDLQDGVGVRFDAGSGKVSIDYCIDGKNTVLASRFIRIRDGKMQVSNTEFESDGKLAMPEGAGVNWYKVTMVDDGSWLFVYLDGVPICAAPYDASKLTGSLVVIGDREPTANHKMVTYVRKLTIIER